MPAGEILFQDLFDMVLQMPNIILYQELQRHRFILTDKAIVAERGVGNGRNKMQKVKVVTLPQLHEVLPRFILIVLRVDPPLLFVPR